MTAFRRWWFYWVDHPLVDYLVSGTAIAVMASAWRLGWDPVGHLSQDARISWSTAMAVVAAGLLGFGIATISILFAVTPGPRLGRVLKTVGARLGGLLMATLRALALATVGFFATPLLDSAATPSSYWVIVFGLVILSVLRLLRLLWLLAKTISALSQDVGETSNHKESGWVAPPIAESDYEIPKREVR